MAKKGRPSNKNATRYPCGQIKRETDTIAPTLIYRIREHATKFGLDAKLSTELGRLLLLERINAGQAAGGFKYAEIVGRAAYYDGGRRFAKSPSYEMGFRGAETREGSDVFDDIEARRTAEPSEYELRAFDAENKYRALQFQLTRQWNRSDLAVLERLCVDDEAINPTLMPTIRKMLDAIVAHFGTAAAPKKNKNKKTQKPIIALRPQTKTKPAGEMDLALSMMARLRPDLDRDRLTVEWNNFCALRAREHFRNQRQNRIGAI